MNFIQNISIAICTYNGEKRLENVIKKIYEEPMLSHYVKEVIIIDNHSTDRTKDIVDFCSHMFIAVPIKYIYEERPGLSSARKRAVNSCTTKWIAFLDDDNYVEPDWIENIANYIHVNPDVGAFNGAVLPRVSFIMTAEEEIRLKASFKVLACTHYSIEKLERNPKTPFRNPIGAGMIIMTSPLKELSKKGWLKLSGRTKDSLASGEDMEMAYWIKKQGYKFGFCPKAVIYHEISKGRLKDEYLKKIWYEIGHGVAVVVKEQRTNYVQQICYRILLFTRLLIYTIQNKYKGKYYKYYIDGYNRK